MTIKNSDLKALFLSAANQEFLDVPAEKNLNHVFSPGFVAWGKEMTGEKPVITRAITLKKVAHIILIAALIAALLAGTALAFPAVRNVVKKFFVRQGENNVSYIDFGDYSSIDPCVEYTETTEVGEDGVTPITKTEVILRAEAEYTDLSGETSTSFEYRSPTYFPAGLVIESEVTSLFTISIVTRSPEGHMCDYLQSVHPEDNNVGIAMALGDDYVHSEQMVCETLMDVFCCESTTIYLWSDEFYLYSLLVNADMPMEEVERIIYSIEPREDLNNP